MANILNKLLRMAVGKIPEGAGALPDAPSDPSKRSFLKGSVAVGAVAPVALGALSKLPIEKIGSSITKTDLFEKGIQILPSFQKSIDEIDIGSAKNTIANYRSDLSLPVGGPSKFDKKLFRDLGYDPNNLPENFSDEELLKIARLEESRRDFPMSNLELVNEDLPEIDKFLSNEVELSEIGTPWNAPGGENVNVTQKVLSDLKFNYNLNNDEIKKVLNVDLLIE